MPSRNSIKQFDSDSMYHVYNRGNNKRTIFFDEKDYAVFLSYIKYALLSDDDFQARAEVSEELISSSSRFNLRRLGLHNRVELVAYCLMPNHFHLLLYQYDPDAIPALMRSIATGYSMYFNKRHNCSGKLYQGVYKAAPVDNQPYWEHISRYIHLNPIDLGVDYKTYDFSSYRQYMGYINAKWLKQDKGMIGASPEDYASFVESWIPYRKELKDLDKYLAG